MSHDTDVIVVGAGLAGLVAATEIADAGKRVIVLDQEGEQNLGGQAFWSFGGLFLVNSPEQRRLRIKDSFELALQDWYGAAGFDRTEDHWPKRWAEAYVAFAAGEKRGWLRAMGHRIFPVVGWAERGGYDATGPWQLGAALSCQLGNRPRRRRAVRTARARGRGARIDHLQVPPPRRRAVADERRGRRRQRCHPRAVGGTARRQFLAQGGRRICIARAGRDRRLRRHRRQPRPRPAELAEAPRRAAEAHGGGRAGACGRPHDRHHREGRRAADQPRPHVALRRGPAQLEPDLARPRHPHPARAVVDVVRRHRQAPARRRSIRATTRSASSSTSWRPATTIPGSC